MMMFSASGTKKLCAKSSLLVAKQQSAKDKKAAVAAPGVLSDKAASPA